MESFFKKINFIETETRMVAGCQGEGRRAVMAREHRSRVQISLVRRLNFEDLIYSMVTVATYRALCTLNTVENEFFKQTDSFKEANYVR